MGVVSHNGGNHFYHVDGDVMIKVLIAFFGAVFGRGIAFFATYVSYKMAVVAASAALFIALTLALTLALKALMLGIYMVMPVQFNYAAQFLPSNITQCFVAMTSARLALWAYNVKVKVHKYWLGNV